MTKKGEIELRNLEEWFDTYQFINSFELNDASFEHDTQATTGRIKFKIIFKLKLLVNFKIFKNNQYKSV